jgi:eukaryotic-like serine/threonine-protein kinase
LSIETSSPANILINGPAARLGDLGLAKVLMMDDDFENVDDVASYVAMPRFFRTPELVSIARGEKADLTTASDIYQLGSVLYRCLTNFNPQRPPKEIFTEDIELDVRPISGVGGHRLDTLLEQMLDNVPSKRPAASEVLNSLNIIHNEICTADLDATGMMR